MRVCAFFPLYLPMILPNCKLFMMQYNTMKRSRPYANVLIIALLILMGRSVSAQDIQSTPLSRLGYGTMQSSAPISWKGMGGTGVGMNDKRVINLQNPAGYGATDSLSFLIELGASVNMSHYRFGEDKKNTFLGGIDYIAIQFPLYKDRIAFSAGLVPMSNVGYGLVSEVNPEGGDNINRFLESYSGKGSLQSVYMGLGSRVFKNLYLGANARYHFGKVAHSVHLMPSTSRLSQIYSEHSVRLKSWSFDLGMQYRFLLPTKRQDQILFGVTYSPKLSITPELLYFENRNFGSQNKPEITELSSNPKTSLPHKIAAGLSWSIPERMTIAADYGLEMWEGSENIFANDGVKMMNRHKVALGMELLPDFYSRNYFQKMSYRWGVNYGTSYLEIPQLGTLRTIGASVGIGMPVNMTSSDRLSLINLTLEYQKDISPISKAFSQDVLKLSLGISFNETWFRKLKIY